jgi:hypothetical protein
MESPPITPMTPLSALTEEDAFSTNATANDEADIEMVETDAIETAQLIKRTPRRLRRRQRKESSVFHCTLSRSIALVFTVFTFISFLIGLVALPISLTIVSITTQLTSYSHRHEKLGTVQVSVLAALALLSFMIALTIQKNSKSLSIFLAGKYIYSVLLKCLI